MVNVKGKLLGISLSIALVGQASGQIFSGPAFFSVLPTTQMGSFIDQLTINSLNPLGFSVAGQFIVNVQPGVVTGTLLRYQVKRPLNPFFGSQNLSILQYLIGYSQPPVGGTYGNTSGYCKTYLDVGGQNVNSNLFLTNGAQTWNLNVQSQSFNYTSGTDLFLVQEFDLDGTQISGAGGQWVVDLPVDSLLVPEPTSLASLALGALCLRRRARRA